jgi:hypothetical protein
MSLHLLFHHFIHYINDESSNPEIDNQLSTQNPITIELEELSHNP